MLCGPDGELPEKLRNLEPRLIEHVSNEIMDRDPNVRWDDIGIVRCMVTFLNYESMLLFSLFSSLKLFYSFVHCLAGLEHAKKCVTEMVIWPLLRPDIFKGCRSPGKGLLLFGPPVSIVFSSEKICPLQCFLAFVTHLLIHCTPGNREDNDWESYSWRGKSNLLLHIC